MAGAAPPAPPGPHLPATVMLLLWCAWASPSTVARVVVADGDTRARGRGIKSHLLPRAYDFHHCTDRKHFLDIKNFTFYLDKAGYEYCDTDFEILRPARTLSALTLQVRRCPLGAKADCEYFQTWTWTVQVCNLMYAEHLLWTPLIHNIQPTFKCPLRKGPYLVRNSTLDFDSMEKMIAGLNLDKFAWPAKVMVDVDKVLHLCFDFTFEAIRVMVKD